MQNPHQGRMGVGLKGWQMYIFPAERTHLIPLAKIQSVCVFPYRVFSDINAVVSRMDFSALPLVEASQYRLMLYIKEAMIFEYQFRPISHSKQEKIFLKYPIIHVSISPCGKI